MFRAPATHVSVRLGVVFDEVSPAAAIALLSKNWLTQIAGTVVVFAGSVTAQLSRSPQVRPARSWLEALPSTRPTGVASSIIGYCLPLLARSRCDNCVADPRNLVSATETPLTKRLKNRFALDERQSGDLLAIEVQEIKGVLKRASPRARRRSPPGCGRSSVAPLVDAAEFAVDVGVLHVEVRERRDGALIFIGPVEAGARQELRGPCESRPILFHAVTEAPPEASGPAGKA